LGVGDRSQPEFLPLIRTDDTDLKTEIQDIIFFRILQRSFLQISAISENQW
jgi:hypothetical protein